MSSQRPLSCARGQCVVTRGASHQPLEARRVAQRAGDPSLSSITGSLAVSGMARGDGPGLGVGHGGAGS